MNRTSRQKRERVTADSSATITASSRRKQITHITLGIITVLALTAAIVITFKPSQHTVNTPRQPVGSAPIPFAPLIQIVQYEPWPKKLDDLRTLDPAKLGDLDIARVNLLCATNLPGSEKIDIEYALATLDQWAKIVAFETNRHLYRVHDPRYADHFRHSEAYLRAEFLMQTLCEKLGVKYDMSARGNFSFHDSRVAFIHGMIPMPGQTLQDTPGGTCASMPVLAAAVGRRLGYPIKLASTNGHLFARWDGKDHPNPAWRERFNMEVTSGFDSFDDDYYKSFPHKLTEHEIQVNGYLLSLTPQEEFASFMSLRGSCGESHNQLTFAAQCQEVAYNYAPNRRIYREWFIDAATKCNYQPTTPALAEALELRRHAEAMRRNAMATPTFGGMAAGAAPNLMDIAPMRIGQWQQPPPMMPGVASLPFGQSQPIDPRAEVERINAINRANLECMERLSQPSPATPQSPRPGIPQPYRPPGFPQPPRP